MVLPIACHIHCFYTVKYNNLNFVEGVFLSDFLKESSSPYLFVSFSAFLIPCHLVVALSINLSDSTYTKSVIACQHFFFKGHFKNYLVEKGRADWVTLKILSEFLF